MMKEKIILFESLSKYRTIFMGISILFVIFFHSGLERYIHIPYFKTLLQGMYSGVDAFFLLSAIGIYFSFRKESNVIMFYKKRFIRIIPLYWASCLINIGITDKLTFTNILYAFTTLDFWLGSSTLNWYIPSIIFLYLLFPFYYKLFSRQPIITTLLGITVSIYIAIFVLEAPFSDYKLFWFRVPIYLIGIFIARSICEKKKDFKYWSYIIILLGVIATIVFVIIYDNYIGLHWNGGIFYPFIFIYLGFFVFLGMVFNQKNKIKNLFHRVFFLLGSISYELYLIHFLTIHFAYYLMIQYKTNYIIAMIACAFILSFVLSYFVHKVSNKYITPFFTKILIKT